MNGLPEGWEATTFGDVFDFKGGSQPPKSTFFPEPGAGRIRLLQIRDFESDEKAVYIEDNGKWPRCEANDVMVGRYGASVGKVLSGKAGAYNVALVKWLFDHDLLDRDWVETLLRSNLFQEPLAMLSRSAQNGFNKGDVEKFPLALPPLAEQRRIVEKLDQLSARTRAAKDHLARVGTLATRAKQTTLAAAFRGELTSMSDRLVKGPSDEFWSVPEGWAWKTVADVGAVALGRQRSPKNHNGPQMRPYIRAANITWAGIDLSDVKEMNFDDADYARFALKPGDVLLNEGSGSPKEVGKPAIWRGEIAEACFQNTVLRVQPTECSAEYLYWYFYRTALHAGFVDSTQGVNIQHIGKKGLAEFPIPVPSPEEQTEIVRRIEAAFARIDRMVAEAARAAALLERLEAQLFAKAFRGELVPQDPTDEPASALLARIREARANAPKPKRKRRS